MGFAGELASPADIPESPERSLEILGGAEGLVKRWSRPSSEESMSKLRPENIEIKSLAISNY
jgi:hypothetical protein